MCQSRRAIFLGLLLPLSFTACSHSTHYVTTNGQLFGPFVFGDTVDIILETSSQPSHWPDEPSSDTNVRGYLLTASLSKTDGAGPTRFVVGLIYELDGPVSSIANSAGATYSQQDRSFLESKPFLALHSAGELIKSNMVDKRKNWHDWQLQVANQQASWKDLGERARLPLLGWPNPNYFESMSRRYAVQKESDGKVEVFDLFTSAKVYDPWLEKVAKNYLSQEDLGNGKIFLLDDLNYLVVFLSIGNTVRENGADKVLEEFTIDGETMRRENHFLVYQRPAEKPTIYSGSGWQSKPVEKDGKLLICRYLETRIVLQALDNQTVVAHDFTADEKWLADPLTFVQSDFAGKRIIATNGPELISSSLPESKIRVAAWDYSKNRLAQYTIPITDLFELRKTGYYPKAAISIDSPQK
jgi:hypothetical protein